MSEYSVALEETRRTVRLKAKEAVTKLYSILTDKEKKPPEEARKILEHDLGDIFAKRTILQFLPEETKDEDKVKAGKTEKKKILIDTSGNPAADPQQPESLTNNTVEKVKKIYPDIEKEEKHEDEESDPITLSQDAIFTSKRLAKALDDIRDLNIKVDQKDKTITQLQEVVKKDSFKPATDEMNGFDIDDMTKAMLLIEIRKRQWNRWSGRLENAS